MNSLFGIPMDTLMAWMLGLFLVVTASLALLAIRNRLLLKLGLRNIPRRRAQTVLIVVGLMLSTLIITSAFGTGDTISYSIRSAATQNLGPIDEIVTSAAANTSGFGTAGVTFIPGSTLARVTSALAGSSHVAGVTGVTVVGAPLQDLTTGQTKDRAALAGIAPQYSTAFGALTTTTGATADIAALGPGEVYLNARAATALSAHAGDEVVVYVGRHALHRRVRAILKNENLAAGGLLSDGQQSDPTVFMPRARVQALLGHPGSVTAILVANRGGGIGGAQYSDSVTGQLRALLANTAQVATVKALLRSPAGSKGLQAQIRDPLNRGVKSKLTALAAQVALPGETAQLKNLLSDPQVSTALQRIKDARIAAPLNDALTSISAYTVQSIMQDALNLADLIGSVFTTIFVVFGLFSIAAGVMLIFLIFVMLAAERRPEMGMARAIGTRRRQLIEQFLFEGYVYDLGAALVGVVLGIGVGLGMVQVMASLFGASGFTIQGHVEPRSLIVAFCLGALVTFVTVAFSSWRISRLNVVAAIRDLPEDHGIDKSIAAAFVRPFQDLATAGRRLRRFHLLGAIGATAVALWHMVTAWGVFISRGVLLLPIGYLLADAGIRTKQESFFTLGVSLLMVGIAMTIRWLLARTPLPDAVRNRIGYSLAGILLVIFWLLPFGALKRFGVPELNGGIEMFFVSGIMLVIGGVWTVVYNSDLILGALLRIFGGQGSLVPILKTAVTYPMQNKFRTGLTLAMFSLVIFTLMVMSVLIGSTSTSLDYNLDTGGYQIYGTLNPNTPVSNLAGRIAHTASLKGIAAFGGLAPIPVGIRQPTQADQRWHPYVANIADATYLASTRFVLHGRAAGYTSDQQVWNTIRTHPGFAVVDDTLLARKQSTSFGAGGSFTIAGIYYENTRFTAPHIEVRDTRSGAIMHLTVIGVLDQRAENMFALTQGIYTSEQTLTAAGAPPIAPTTLVFRTAPDAHVHALALALGRTFLRNGLDVKEVKQQFDDNQAIGSGLDNLLQAFMGLGLVVGIAALGVIAFRSVVERRQQIGMLRAIGFQRSMIRDSFLLESSFVAILGTLLGVLLGLALARNLVENIASTNPGISLTVPWLQILIIVAIAYAASLLTTYIPAWQASRIYPAQALRYE
jgi:putative ABC transport system permease protein